MAHDKKTKRPVKTSAAPQLQLPVLVATPVDLNRLLLELEAIEDRLLQVRLRKGNRSVRLPKTSQLMDLTIQLNKLNLIHPADRKALLKFLRAVKQAAPLLHISFGADPSVDFIEKLMTWLRREIHPQVLLTVGLQPAIGAGCMVRSTNRYFDFTLRHRFDNQRELLVQKLASVDAPSQETG